MKKLTLLLITLCILITTVYAYNLTTIVNGNKLTATVNSGENVTIEYEDIDGYKFDSWSATGVTLTNPTSKNTNFTMPANDVTIEPNMTLSHVHSYSDATCTVPPTCSCGVTEGNALGHTWNNATCTTAKTCSVCSATEGNALGHSYTGNRTCNVNGSTDTVQCTKCTSTESQTCTHEYTITVTQGDNGNISPTTATVKGGGSATFIVTANSGYEISDVKVNGTSVGAKTSHTITNITSNQTITALYGVDKTQIAVGAYITYVPSSTSYTVATTDSGYTSAQNFNPSATTSWRVIYNNSGQLDIVTTDFVRTSSNKYFYLRGKTGYSKAVDTLNNIAQAFVNSTYATSGRHIGSTNESIGTISESSIKHGVNGSPYTDTLYETDVNQLVNNDMLNNNYILLASRYLEAYSGSSTFSVRRLSQYAQVNSSGLYYVRSDGTVYEYDLSEGLRPVVSLKSTIRITSGNGTQESPYVIN